MSVRSSNEPLVPPSVNLSDRRCMQSYTHNPSKFDLGSEDARGSPAEPAFAHPQASLSLSASVGSTNRDNGLGWWGYSRLKHSYDVELDPRDVSGIQSVDNGDPTDNIFCEFYHYLWSIPFVSLFNVLLLVFLWIPAILQLTTYHDAQICEVSFVWWSTWCTVLWAGWWTSLTLARKLPRMIRSVIGAVAVGGSRYLDWLQVLYRYVSLAVWTALSWVTFQPLIVNKQLANASVSSRNNIIVISRLLLAFFSCAAILLFEKVSIQWIAEKFHERTYAERIADQTYAVGALATLYQHSRDIPGREDGLRPKLPADKEARVNPKRFLRSRAKRVGTATTTTIFGNLASQIAGTPALEPTSPQAIVISSLESVNGSLLLAHRLFYSFVKAGADSLLIDDIAPFFPTMEEAEHAFSLFDRDDNGDATREEVELSCLECHREQISMEHSMRDLDSAVGRLDNIFMSLYAVVVILIISVALQTGLLSLVTGTGTLVLGLSWLVGSSLAEMVTSIIFLFIKHPYDVGDRVIIEQVYYTVKEISLLTTVFLDHNHTVVTAPNVLLNQKFIFNIRRSSEMSEPFKFDVAFDTTFEQIEALRGRMIAFLSSQRRDFVAAFDVIVVDFPEQTKMTLNVDIKYKSNVQQAGLKAIRRNKWICALKTSLADVKIFGPAGDPHATPVTRRCTLVPWEIYSDEDRLGADLGESMATGRAAARWNLTDRNPELVDDSGDVFGESNQFRMTNITTRVLPHIE